MPLTAKKNDTKKHIENFVGPGTSIRSLIGPSNASKNKLIPGMKLSYIFELLSRKRSWRYTKSKQRKFKSPKLPSYKVVRNCSGSGKLS